MLLIGESGRVRIGIKSRLDKTFVKNIKGRTLGRTLNAQADIPSKEMDINFAGAKIMLIKKYNIKNVKLEDDIKQVSKMYREFVAMNEGFINIHNTSDIKIPENYSQTKPIDEIKKIIDFAVKNEDLSNLLEL